MIAYSDINTTGGFPIYQMACVAVCPLLLPENCVFFFNFNFTFCRANNAVKLRVLLECENF